MRGLREAGCGLLLWWVPGHTDGATDEHVVQDLCDSLCSGLKRSAWPLLHNASTLFVNDVVATLRRTELGRCTSEVKSWLEADRWKVLQTMHGIEDSEYAGAGLGGRVA